MPSAGVTGPGDAHVVAERALDMLEVERFCTAIYPRLVGSLSLACDDPDLAEELAQDTLSRVLERWDRVRGLDDAEGYTIRIGFNLARSWWRRQAAERRAQTRLTEEASPEEGDDIAQNLALRQAMARLSPRQREAIVHRYFLGHSVSGTAKWMNCAEGTVKALTSQGIDVLRNALETRQPPTDGAACGPLPSAPRLPSLRGQPRGRGANGDGAAGGRRG